MRQYIKQKKIENIDKDIVLIVGIVLIIVFYIFIQGICFPIVGHDASVYAFYGKYLYQEKNLDNYPMKQADEETGAFLKVRHAPGLPLIYTWFYLLQSNTESDLLPRTVAPMYSLYLIILLWIALKKRKNSYCASFGVLLMVLTPLFVKQSLGNTIDPIRIYFIFLSFILLAELLKNESIILFLTIVSVVGLAAYIHTGGILLFPIIIGIYLMLSNKNIKIKILLIISAVIIAGSIQYATKNTKLQNVIGAIISVKKIEYSHFNKIAQLGKERTEINKETGNLLKKIFYERFQIFSTPEFFGLSYYIFLFALFYWARYIHKEKEDVILLLGAILFAIPILYKYWLNNRYIFSIHPLIIYFNGLTLGTIYTNLKRRNLEKRIWYIIIPIILSITISLFLPNSLVNQRIGSVKNVVKYTFTNKKQQVSLTRPMFGAIDYINTQTPLDSTVLVFRGPEYFYNAKRKGIHYEDHRLKNLVLINDVETAYKYLRSLDINYIMIDPRYEQSSFFEKSKLKNILTNENFSKLVYENWTKVYRLKDENNT